MSYIAEVYIMSKDNVWDPKTDYGPDEALRDMLCKDNGPSDVRFTENGVMKDYGDRVDEYISNPNDPRGHDSITYRFDSNGRLDPSKSSFHKH